ncbi:hypothetical protein [Pseudomonas sp. TMP9]|uniref:hypothetical protein n=1 Tax=Pseudomonas sp. TMP9 TaxID=3133144 RepID=UPI0030CA7AAA
MFPLSEAYNSGFSSFNRGDSYKNPHPDLSPEFNLFERGYFQALKTSYVFPKGQKRRNVGNISMQLQRDAQKHMRSI